MGGVDADDGRVVLGRIVGLFGVRGWVKVYAYARPREAILQYASWLVRTADGWHEHALCEGRVHGRGLVARLEGYADRTQAKVLVGATIAVRRSQLAPLPEGEYYWVDLEGLAVIGHGGRRLGVVSHLFETGANDVMVVIPDASATEGEVLVPFVREVIRRVDLAGGVIVVEWGED